MGEGPGLWDYAVRWAKGGGGLTAGDDVLGNGRAVTSDELLRMREDSWRVRLRAVSLVAENLAKAEHTDQALQILGRKYRHNQSASFLRRYPAVQVMSTVMVAAEHYAHGTFWPKLCEHLGGLEGGSFQGEWGSAFLDNLRTLGLPDFRDIEDPGARFVGPILMHAGVPTYCLGDYFRLVQERRSREGTLSPDEFVAWAAARAVEDRLYGIDKPVARFLRYGGDFAVDVTDRVFELLDVVAQGGTGEGVPLPDRFVRAALELRQRGEVVAVRHRGEAGSDAGSRPRLVLDPYGRGPLLRLPAVDMAESAVWSVTIGQQSMTVRSEPQWPGEPAPPTDAPVIGPVRTVSAALVRRVDLTATIPVVDDRDPLLAFTEDGRLLPAGPPLPGSAVWLLFPGKRADLVVQGEGLALAEGVLPPGWAGWTLQLMDLSGARTVRASSSDRSRTVRRVSAVRIVTGEPVAGLRFAGGPVFGEVPSLEFPAGAGDEGGWRLTITDGQGELLVENRAIAPAVGVDYVWEGVPRPLLGSYRVRVRGPWGRGASRDLVIAEGVRVDAIPGWRRICPSGLVPASARLVLPIGMSSDAVSLDLAAAQIERPVVLSVRGRSQRFLVCPPHMSISYQSSERSTAAGVHPVPLYAEDVRAAGGTLTVDLDAPGDPLLHVLVGRHCVQELARFGGCAREVYRFSLAQLSDTLAVHPHVQLALDESGELTVARITPRRLCSGLALLGGSVRLSDGVDVEGLEAVVYLTRAPWRGGTRLSVHEGEASLPIEFQNAGPLVVTVRVDDPWAPAPVPAWPDPRSSQVLDAPGWLVSEDAEETYLSQYLAGQGEFPDDIVDLAMVWSVAARLPRLAVGDRFRDVVAACRHVFREDPVASLLALEESGIEPDRLPEALIRSGMAWAPATLAPRATLNWTRATVLPTALLTATRLASQLGQDSEELAQARAVCGDVIEGLLVGVDPCARGGRYDEGADVYDRLDPDTRVEFRTSAQLVPKGLLDLDTRVQASLDLLDNRREASERLDGDAGRMLKEIRRYLSAVDPVGDQAVADRCHPRRQEGWHAYPALSLGLAWVARRAARGDHSARGLLRGEHRLWADLARIAPELVTIDLIVAECRQASSGSQEEQ